MTKAFYWLAPSYTLVILVGSLVDNVAPPVKIDHVDKLYHAMAYLLMALFWYLFFYSRFLNRQQHVRFNLKTILGNWSRVIGIGAAAISFLIGVLIELGQGYISLNRTMDILDVCANTAGILIALCILILVDRLFNTYKTP